MEALGVRDEVCDVTTCGERRELSMSTGGSQRGCVKHTSDEIAELLGVARSTVDCIVQQMAKHDLKERQ